MIVIFWLVHILPEKVAEKRHHPQLPAITTLCLLSLVFGGLLWPIAWLWAYTRPIGYKMAYGTEKHDDYFVEKTEEARAGKLLEGEIVASARRARCDGERRAPCHRSCGSFGRNSTRCRRRRRTVTPPPAPERKA